MMEEDGNGNKCLICSCVIATTSSSDQSTRTRESSKGSNNSPSSSVSRSTTKHQFHRQLYVIFILRNILELPVHQLASHLRNNWDIQDWISLCDGCDTLVVQCRQIFDQLVKISKKFKLCQQNIIKIVKENSDNGSIGGPKTPNYSDGDKKTVDNKNRFVEKIRNFVLKNDYEHLIDPLEKTRPWTCPNEVKSEITQQNEDNLVIKTEPDDWPHDDNFNNDNSMEASQGTREGEEDDWQQDENTENEEDDYDCKASKEKDKLKKLDGDDNKPKRRKRTRHQKNTLFLCPLCQVYRKRLISEKSAIFISFHLDKCLKTHREKNGNIANDHDISILKCDFCSIYSCPVDDISGFVNHLVSCIFEFTLTPLQHRIFTCNICSDKKSSRERYFSLDGFLNHYSYHRQKYECTECGRLISTTDQIHSHWRRYHKDLAGSLVDYSTCVLKLESPRCPAVPWWCSVCGDVFMGEKERDEHRQSAHPLDSAKELEKKEKCQFCEKFYYCPDELKLHEATAHPLESNQLHQCDQCCDLFVTEKGLLLHRRWRHKLDLLKCSVCNQEFITKAPLVIHLKSHDNDIERFGTNEIIESAKTTENKLVCPVEGCGKLYLYRRNLKDHIASHVKKRVYPCTFCGREFYVEHILKTHVKFRHNESTKKYQCKECPFKTRCMANLKKHKKHWMSSEGRGPRWTGSLKCEICSRRFLGPIQLQQHKRRQHKILIGKRRVWKMKKGPRTANVTKTDKGETESSNNNVTSHENAPEESSNLSCHVCQKAFTKQEKLKRHLSNVHKIGAVIEEDLSCPVEGCGKVYRYRSSFKDHMATHEKKTVYPCSFCGKEFYVKSGVINHERKVHNESEKIYQCEECPYKTGHKGEFNQHQKKWHSSEEMNLRRKQLDELKRRQNTNTENNSDSADFICQICGRAFKCKASLKQHQENTLRCKKLHMSMEEVTVVCHLCGGRFRSEKNLEKHIREQHERIFKVACERCGKGFYARNEYKEHLAITHQTGEYYDNKERFKCPVEGCGKILFRPSARRRHIRHHEVLKSEAQFKCEQCGKAFSADRYRQAHVRAVHQGYKYKKKPKSSGNQFASTSKLPYNNNEGVTDGDNDNCNFS